MGPKETNAQRAARAASAAKTKAAQKRAQPVTGKRGQAERDDAAVRGAGWHSKSQNR